MDGHTAVRAPGAKALAAYLIAEITTGRMPGGVKLPAERTLSEQFETSRGTVRRVLQNLKEQGLIIQSGGSGTFVQPGVAKMDSEAVVPVEVQSSPAQLMQARLLIEPLMPRMIVQNATGGDFARMLECIERSEAAETIEAFEKWDGALHHVLAQATHNVVFVQILELMNRIREQGEWGRLKARSLTPARRDQYQKQHRAIVEALRDRDADAAEVALIAHLDQIQRNLFGA